MDVLLLVGYRKDSHALGLTPREDGVLQIDHQITTLKNLGLNPIVVLSGEESDDVLRKSQFLPDCELIFDTHGDESSLWTGVRAGLYGVDHTCFVLPVEIPCPEKQAWVALKKAFQSTGFSTKIAVLQLIDKKGAPLHWGFPLFLTRLGRHMILNDETLSSLTDSKLKYGHFPYDATEDLAVISSSL